MEYGVRRRAKQVFWQQLEVSQLKTKRYRRYMAMESIVTEIQAEHGDRELHWLISSIITPEFPQIIEALEICSNLILYNTPQHPDTAGKVERGPAIKLPVTSAKSEALKGTVVRDGAYITQMTVVLKETHFNKVLHRMTVRKPVLLAQIITAKKAIDTAVGLIGEATREATRAVGECDQVHRDLMEVFRRLLGEIQTAKSSLQLPTDPALVFPQNVTPAAVFTPELTERIAVDLYINQAEVCLDLKYLHPVHERPWADVDPQGRSYVDKLRDEMRLPSTHASRSSTPAPLQPLNMADIEQRLHDSVPPPEGSSAPTFVSNVLTHLSLKPKHDPIHYITKCVTYNNMVVMVDKKIEVSSPDPVLVSALTKLDSVEYLVSSFLENLQKVVDSLHQ